MIPTYPLLLLTALIATAALGGSIYKWVDANGVTHYAEAPPGA